MPHLLELAKACQSSRFTGLRSHAGIGEERISAPDIFLSYNREDQARAKVFAEAFSAQGFNVWWDVGLRTGEAYDEVTETALRTAKAVVVLWSKKSVASRWVRAEATLADRNKTLVPCMIEACERPIMFELT
ncbi:MAG: toll/interleukin-1 receptor domain-containing protein [Alphaproteobacteria bacterium]|nr:toll/interleukin-1 receptor domain-containing protein [Alphaproteobacteria bacterium]